MARLFGLSGVGWFMVYHRGSKLTVLKSGHFKIKLSVLFNARKMWLINLRLADRLRFIRLFTLPNTNAVLVYNAYTMQWHAVTYATTVDKLKKEMTVGINSYLLQR